MTTAAAKKNAPSGHRTTHTKTDTLLINEHVLGQWKAPPFQRPLRVNGKVTELIDEIRQDGGVIPGVITLGVLAHVTYLLDGQHRTYAFSQTGLEEGYADVRTLFCSNMSEMGEEFVKLNSRLVNFRPDDIIKGLESSCEPVQLLRKKCPFIGYDQVRRGDKGPLVSMSNVLRCWDQSAPETPSGAGCAASTLATALTVDEAETMISFLTLAMEAWGRDPEYFRLWGSLNLILCMWLYRRLVVTQYSSNTVRLTKDQFKKCLMSVSAESTYVEWLMGRKVGERDRSPAFARLKAIFAKRIEADTGVKPRLPGPSWAHGGGSHASRLSKS